LTTQKKVNIINRIRNSGKAKTVSTNSDVELTKGERKNFNFFCYGLLIYTLGYAPTMCAVKAISGPTLQSIQTLGIIILLIGAIGLIRFKFEDQYLEIMFKILFFYGITIILRGLKFDYKYIKTIFFDPDYTIFVYLIPLVMLFPRKLELYKRLFFFLFLYGACFLIFCGIFLDTLLSPNWRNWEAQYVMDCIFLFLAFPVTFLLVTYVHQTKKIKLFAFAVTIICLLLVIFRARRGAILMDVTLLLGVLMVYLIHTKRTALIIFLSVLFTLIISVSMSNIQLPSMFDNLKQRSDDDTRTGVEVAMKADMNPIQWVIGKGLNGTYYCTAVIDDPTNITFQRRVIETGYLQIILNGGLISLSLLILIIFPAIYKGLFKSSNILCKGAAIFMLLWVLYQYPRIVTSFSMYYVLIWISVGMCYSKAIRNMSDITIKYHLRRFTSH
jgi:hypothetical protein